MKFHRFNHHSQPNSAIPDSAHDPIASFSNNWRGEFVIYPDGSLLSARDIATNNIRPFSGDLIEILPPNKLLVSNLTALSATIHQLDLNYSELSGFMVIGEDYSLSIPSYILIPGYNNLLLNGIGISGTSWASFGGDLKTNRDLYVTRTGDFSTVNTDNLTVTEPVGNLDVVDLTVTDLRGNPDINCYDNINLNNNNINNANIINTNVISANTYLGLSSNFTFNIKDKWTELSYNQPLGDSSTIASNTSSTLVIVPSGDNELFVTVTVEALSSTSYGEIFGIVVDNLNQEKVVGLARVGNLGLLPDSDVEHAHNVGMIIDAGQSFSFFVLDNYNYYLSARDIARPIDVWCRTLQRQDITYSLSDATLNLNGLSLSDCLSTDCIKPYTPDGTISMHGNVSTSGTLSSSDIVLTNATTFYGTVTSSDLFLTININGSALKIPLYT